MAKPPLITDEERIAKIRDTWLGFEDHGVFGFNISLDYGDHGQQGFGFYGLGHTERETQQWIPDPRGLEAVRGIIEAAGVEKWEQLKGRTVFAIIEDGWVRGIKPLPTERGRPFDVRQLWPRDQEGGKSDDPDRVDL